MVLLNNRSVRKLVSISSMAGLGNLSPTPPPHGTRTWFPGALSGGMGLLRQGQRHLANAAPFAQPSVVGSENRAHNLVGKILHPAPFKALIRFIAVLMVLLARLVGYTRLPSSSYDYATGRVFKLLDEKDNARERRRKVFEYFNTAITRENK